MKTLISILGLLMGLSSSAQGQYSIESVLYDIKTNSDLRPILGYIQDETTLSLNNVNTRLLPQTRLTAKATYQSETTNIDIEIPGIDIDQISKDQYKIQAEIQQVIFDGGMTSSLKEIALSKSIVDITSVEMQTDKLLEQGINVFFGIKELELNEEQLHILLEKLNATESKLSAGVQNGIVLKTELNNLQAEKILIKQKLIALKNKHAAWREMLFLLTKNKKSIDQELIINTLQKKHSDLNPMNPQIKIFEYQKNNLEISKRVEDIRKKPQLAAIANLGYGNPGLNFLRDGFQPYYLVGLQLNWNLSALYTSKNQKEIYTIDQLKLAAQQQAVKTSISIKNTQLQNDIRGLEETLSTDDQIINIRKYIRETANIQLENGSITSAEFIIKLNEENAAILMKKIRNLQIIKSKYLIRHNNGWTDSETLK